MDCQITCRRKSVKVQNSTDGKRKFRVGIFNIADLCKFFMICEKIAKLIRLPLCKIAKIQKTRQITSGQMAESIY